MSRPQGPPPYTAEQIANLSTPKERFVAEAELRSYIAGHQLANERERSLDGSSTMFAISHDQDDYSASEAGYGDNSPSNTSLPNTDDNNDQGQSDRSERVRGPRADRRAVRIHGGYQPYPTTSEARAKPQQSQFKASKSKERGPQFIATENCSRFGRSNIHNSSKMALCKSWLYKSECNFGENCDVSHNPSLYNTPHCLYYLQGRCKKSPCLFAHVDVDPAALVCDQFGRRGYCDRGADCTKLHVYECPEYANQGTCAAGDKCALKHIYRAARMRARHSSSAAGSPQPSEYVGDANRAESAVWSDDPHAITQQHDYVPFDLGD